jgi:hypothetical protein
MKPSKSALVIVLMAFLSAVALSQTTDPPIITSTTDGSRMCDGTVTLKATCDTGTIHWYAAAVGDTALGSGDTFITPHLFQSYTYYVDATLNGVTTPARTAVNAIITPCSASYLLVEMLTGRWYYTGYFGGQGGEDEPSVPVAGDSVIITRIPGTDSISWLVYHNCLVTDDLKYDARWEWNDDYNSMFQMLYDTNARYVLDFHENRFNIGYFDMRDQYFYWYSRIDTFTLHDPPVITAITNGSLCGPGEVILQAASNVGTVRWYAVPVGDTVIATGNSFVTPFLESTMVYYVEAADNGCVTPARMAVTAIISDHDTCQVNSVDPAFTDKLKIYPNPTTGKVEILFNESFDGDVIVEVMTDLGNLVEKKTAVNNGCAIKLDLSTCPSGLYFIRMHTNRSSYTYKVIKE